MCPQNRKEAGVAEEMWESEARGGFRKGEGARLRVSQAE